MAKMCLDYLKENDYIYVSGRLQTDVKPEFERNSRLFYKVRDLPNDFEDSVMFVHESLPFW